MRRALKIFGIVIPPLGVAAIAWDVVLRHPQYPVVAAFMATALAISSILDGFTVAILRDLADRWKALYLAKRKGRD